MNRKQLLQLSADLDRVIELRSDDEESHYLRNTGAVGALGVGGAYLRGKRIPVNAPGGLLTAAEAQPGFMGAARRAGGTIAQGGKALAGDLGLTGIKDTFMKGYSREGGGIMRGIRGVARKLTKGRSSMVGLSAKTENLLNLSAELDEVINFDFMGMVKKYGPAVGKSALKWGGIGAAGGAVAGGVSGALSEDPNQSALGGALGGAAAGGLLGAAGGAGMRGMKINSAINKAAGLRAARSKAAAASVTPVAAAPTATAAADQMAAAAAQPAKAAAAVGKPSAYAEMPSGNSSFVQPRHVTDPMGYGIRGNTINPIPSKINVARTTSTLRDPNTSVADALTNKRKAIYENGMNTPRGMKNPTVFSSRLQSLVQLSADLDGVVELARGDRYTAEMGATYIPPRGSKTGFIGDSMRYRTVDPAMAADSLKDMKFLKKLPKRLILK
jgi:hypothetical protein